MKIKISKDFTTAPGPRYISEGKYSGELFRQSILLPLIKLVIRHEEVITIDLDGTSGYGCAFLCEAFGGLVRENGLDAKKVRSILKFISKEEPYLINEIDEILG